MRYCCDILIIEHGKAEISVHTNDLFKGSVTRDWDWLSLVSEERSGKVRAARMGPKVDRRTGTKLLTKEALQRLFFSIRIWLKPLRLALSKIVQRQSKKTRGVYSTIAFYYILENPRSSIFPANPIGADKFCSANRRGFKQIRMEKNRRWSM